MVPGFELLFDCNNKLPELKKEDTNWVLTDWVDYMDPDAMTTFLGYAICNIEEEEYWEACQHALKSPYEASTSDREAPSDDNEGSNSKSDSSSNSSSSNNGDGEDDSNSESESNNSEDYDS